MGYNCDWCKEEEANNIINFGLWKGDPNSKAKITICDNCKGQAFEVAMQKGGLPVYVRDYLEEIWEDSKLLPEFDRMPTLQLFEHFMVEYEIRERRAQARLWDITPNDPEFD
jgi:hypothetical protein